MARLLAIFVLCALSCSPLVRGECNKEDLKKQVHEAMEDCVKEMNGSESDIQDMMKQVPLSDSGKCVQSCIFKRLKIMTDSGEFDKSGALDFATCLSGGDPEQVKIGEQIIGNCDEEELSEDHCEAAGSIYDCFIKNGSSKLMSHQKVSV